jgi:hypothetical protein
MLEKFKINKIKNNCIIPSAAKTISRKLLYEYAYINRPPEEGDVIYGEIVKLGQHLELENKNARLHRITGGVKAIFVFGNRYAPDYYEGIIPQNMTKEISILARSGIVGTLLSKNDNVKEPTVVRILGYVLNSNGEIVNTKNYNLIKPNQKAKKDNRAKLILNIGTSMNSGKSMSGASCCASLSYFGKEVRFSKITGTASLKDILNAQDMGARIINDFTYMGYPSTYMLDEKELLHIFNSIDLKFANNPHNYWVVELADGILQRETAMLLENKKVQSRIHKLVLSAHCSLSAIGGLSVLKNEFGLVPDAISGILSSSPLFVNELEAFTDIPVINNLNPNLEKFYNILK